MVTGKPAWFYCTGENSGVQGPKDLPALQIRGSSLSSRGAGWRPVDRAHLERGWVLLSGDPATSLNPLTEFCDSHNLGFFFLFFFAGLHCWGFLEKSCVLLRIESWLCMDGLCVPEYNGLCIAHKAVHRPWGGRTYTCLPAASGTGRAPLHRVSCFREESLHLLGHMCCLLVKPSSVLMGVTRHRPLVYKRYKPQRSWSNRGTATPLGVLPSNL